MNIFYVLLVSIFTSSISLASVYCKKLCTEPSASSDCFHAGDATGMAKLFSEILTAAETQTNSQIEFGTCDQKISVWNNKLKIEGTKCQFSESTQGGYAQVAIDFSALSEGRVDKRDDGGIEVFFPASLTGPMFCDTGYACGSLDTITSAVSADGSPVIIWGTSGSGCYIAPRK